MVYPLSHLVISSSWQAAVLVAVAALLTPCFRTARCRSTVWSSTLVLATLVPVITIAVPKYVISSRVAAVPLLSGPQLWVEIVVVAWVAGAVVAALRLVLAWIAAARLVRMSRPTREPLVQKRIARMIGIGSPAVRFLPSLQSPFCWQFCRTILVLPAVVEDYSDEDVQLILRHELFHLRHRDPLRQFLQRISEVIYWYHPAVWWASWQASKYREFACDDAVVGGTRLASSYAKVMTRLTEQEQCVPVVAPTAVGLLWTEKLMIRRLRRLAETAKEAPLAAHRALRGAGLFSLAAAAVLVAVVRYGPSPFVHRHRGWTAWPRWTAQCLHAVGIPVRDFELDAHRLQPHERTIEHIAAHRNRVRTPSRNLGNGSRDDGSRR